KYEVPPAHSGREFVWQKRPARCHSELTGWGLRIVRVVSRRQWGGEESQRTAKQRPRYHLPAHAHSGREFVWQKCVVGGMVCQQISCGATDKRLGMRKLFRLNRGFP
ncbi:MAG: hypothetical protein DMG11_27255, partial [Acidobacteria bacterium]